MVELLGLWQDFFATKARGHEGFFLRKNKKVKVFLCGLRGFVGNLRPVTEWNYFFPRRHKGHEVFFLRKKEKARVTLLQAAWCASCLCGKISF
jgi:hypothetical protein